MRRRSHVGGIAAIRVGLRKQAYRELRCQDARYRIVYPGHRNVTRLDFGIKGTDEGFVSIRYHNHIYASVNSCADVIVVVRRDLVDGLPIRHHEALESQIS